MTLTLNSSGAPSASTFYHGFDTSTRRCVAISGINQNSAYGLLYKTGYSIHMAKISLSSSGQTIKFYSGLSSFSTGSEEFKVAAA